ncbi:DUF3231 family protein [Paenibacillus sp. IB182496]|uniref:DUF3231 family protein n=1 Tax=Paenibacillus sabuli TaxID=2772509 RepID=A0A927BUZ5_9BACL|nr:DUF3231 family protein [Paenibacillus sabuli]MBD2845989.1 DUF3231 family protein [Paenibacillus sabuli]
MTPSNIRLTATEIGGLWSTFMNDSMVKCMLQYFLGHVEEDSLRSVLEFALNFSTGNLAELNELFRRERFPIPQGFSESDVDTRAPRLYTDCLIMQYIKNMSDVGLITYANAYASASRPDIRAFFLANLDKSKVLQDKIVTLLDETGQHVHPPSISIPERIQTSVHEDFFSGHLFGWGDKRVLTSVEIGQLYKNAKSNWLGNALLLGFAQVAKEKELRDHMVRGIEISKAHAEFFESKLQEDHIPFPSSWDNEVTASTKAPFSDKLMLYHVTLLVATGTANYGVALAVSPRSDLAIGYGKLTLQIANYAKDGAKLLVQHHWFEAPPLADDRKALTETLT